MRIFKTLSKIFLAAVTIPISLVVGLMGLILLSIIGQGWSLPILVGVFVLVYLGYRLVALF